MGDPCYRKYIVYLDDGKFVYKIAIAAVTEDAAKAWCAGNGEVIAVKDVTDDYRISSYDVSKALENAGFGEYKIDFIVRALTELGITE